MGGSERLVCVTGTLYGGLLRVVDVDIAGNVQGSPSYLPSNQILGLMDLENGVLVDRIDEDNEEEIDWAAHEDQPGDIALDETAHDDSDDYVDDGGRPNPMLAAIQVTQKQRK